MGAVGGEMNSHRAKMGWEGGGYGEGSNEVVPLLFSCLLKAGKRAHRVGPGRGERPGHATESNTASSTTKRPGRVTSELNGVHRCMTP